MSNLEEIVARNLKKTPQIHESVFISPSANVIGDVELAENASVWNCAVVRGDVGRIEIGRFSNIQDCAVIHPGWTRERDTGIPVSVGEYVSIAHGAIIHGATIEDNVIISMNATVMNGAQIGSNSIIGAGAVVTQGAIIPANSICFGIPAKNVKTVNEEQMELIKWNAAEYYRLAKQYLKFRQ
jgi:carbonic anhydrase/acetyltransferase-like protein (isoleucine patch superfamily)